MQNTHDLKVGDILVSKWGYDQTNIEFYKVISLTKMFAKLIKLKAMINHNNDAHTYLAYPTAETEGNEFCRKIGKWFDQSVCITIADREFARKVEIEKLEYGIKGTSYA